MPNLLNSNDKPCDEDMRVCFGFESATPIT